MLDYVLDFWLDVLLEHGMVSYPMFTALSFNPFELGFLLVMTMLGQDSWEFWTWGLGLWLCHKISCHISHTISSYFLFNIIPKKDNLHKDNLHLQLEIVSHNSGNTPTSVNTGRRGSRDSGKCLQFSESLSRPRHLLGLLEFISGFMSLSYKEALPSLHHSMVLYTFGRWAEIFD